VGRLTHRFLPLVALVLVAAGCGHGARRSDWRLLVWSDRDGDTALYTVDVASGRSARMMRGGAMYAEDPIPSPDGRTLFLPGRHPHLLRVDGSGRRRIALSWLATVTAWSPDAKRLAYTPAGDTGIWTYDLSSGRRTRISFGENDAAPSWSPDARRIAFDGDDGVFVADSDGRDTRRLSSIPAANTPAWSPDGKTIAVADASSPVSRLLLLPVAGGNKPLRVIGGGEDGVWSPDGRRLAFTANHHGHSDLFVARGDGSRPRRLTFGAGGAEVVDVRWTPAGDRIVFQRFGGHAPGELELSELWSIAPDGSGLREITHAYPAGGNNHVLGWVRGKLRQEPRPRPWARPRTLFVPYPAGALTADGRRVAVAPLVPYSGDAPLLPSGPLLVWRPGSRSIAAYVAARCIFPDYVTLADVGLVFDCDDSGGDSVSQSVRVYRRSDRPPVEVFYAANGAHGEINSGTSLGKLAGRGSLVAFTSQVYEWTGKDLRFVAKRLWRVDGTRRRLLLADRGLGDPVDVNGGWIALQGGRAGAAVVDRDGRRVDHLRVPELRSSRQAFSWLQRRLVLTGSRAAVLAGGQLRVYDVRSGRRIASWPLAQPPEELAGAAAGLVVFVHGRLVHVVRLRDGREAVFDVPAHRIPGANPATKRVRADISAAGLYYSYNLARGRYPGRVVFVPLARVVARLRAA
jgi:Tol biopolymer transport system component